MRDTLINKRTQTRNIDPIWKTLRVTRIISGVWFICLLILVAFIVKDEGIQVGLLWTVFILIYGFIPMTLQFLQERHWNQITQRRVQALNHPETLLTSVLRRPLTSEPELAPPIHLQLHQNRKLMLSMLVFMFILIIAITSITLIFSGNYRPLHPETLLLTLGIPFLTLVILLLLYLFIQAHYLTQTIDITDDGITTSYQHQQRSIRWDEVRVFARYNAVNWASNPIGHTYELANNDTVVRWSQRPNLSMGPKSKHIGDDNFNSLVGQITTLVMARTGQPLHNLEQTGHTQKNISTVSATAVEENTSQEHLTPIAQDDPLINKLTGKRAKYNWIIFGALGIIFTAGGLLEYFFLKSDSTFTGVPSLKYGIFMLFITLLLVILTPKTRRYWFNIQSRRQFTVQHPERNLASTQPVPNLAQPQPARLYIAAYSASLNKQTLTVSLTTFIVCLLLGEYFFFSFTPQYQLAILGGSLLLTLMVILLIITNRNKAIMQRIEVSNNGISTRYANDDVQINWEDARLFSTYKALKTFNRGSSSSQIYELVGEQTVVRWAGLRTPQRSITTEPPMSREEYASWLAQLHGYITEKTHLPLHDLDQDV